MTITDESITLRFDAHGDQFLLGKLVEAMGKTWPDEASEIRIGLAIATGKINVSARPIGSDQIERCFVCGSDNGNHPFMANMCLMCSTQKEAELVRNLLQGSRIAYYHGDQKAPQVKVGACKKHQPNLTALYVATHGARYLNTWIVQMCCNLND